MIDSHLGDSSNLVFPLTWEGFPFTPTAEWFLLSTIKRRIADPDSKAVVQKALGAGLTVAGSEATVHLVTVDTNLLLHGVYWIDVRGFNMTTGEARTLSAPEEVELKFVVTQEGTTSVPVYTSEPPYPATGPEGPAGPMGPQGPAGPAGAGVDEYVDLLDASSVNLPSINNPLNTALSNKANTDVGNNFAGSNNINTFAGHVVINGNITANGHGIFGNGVGDQVQFRRITNWDTTAFLDFNMTNAASVTMVDNARTAWKAPAALNLDQVDNTSDANKPISSAGQTALNLKANKANEAHTGTTSFVNVTISGTLDVTSGLTTVMGLNVLGVGNFPAGVVVGTVDAEADVIIWGGITADGNVTIGGTLGVGGGINSIAAVNTFGSISITNYSQASGTVTLTGTALTTWQSTLGITTINTNLAGKANLAGANSFTGATATNAFGGHVTVAGDFTANGKATFGNATADQVQFNGTNLWVGQTTLSFTLANPSAVGMDDNSRAAWKRVGALDINNVNNTSDADKPVSTATQTALNLKANLAGSNNFTDAVATNTFGGHVTVAGKFTHTGNDVGITDVGRWKSVLGFASTGSSNTFTASNLFAVGATVNGTFTNNVGSLSLDAATLTNWKNTLGITTLSTSLAGKANIAGPVDHTGTHTFSSTMNVTGMNLFGVLFVINGATLVFEDPEESAQWRRAINIGLAVPKIDNDDATINLTADNTMSSGVVEANWATANSARITNLLDVKAGDCWEICQTGAGLTTLIATTSVGGQSLTLQYPPGGGPKSAGQYATMFLRIRSKTSTNAVVLVTGGVP